MIIIKEGADQNLHPTRIATSTLVISATTLAATAAKIPSALPRDSVCCKFCPYCGGAGLVAETERRQAANQIRGITQNQNPDLHFKLEGPDADFSIHPSRARIL